MAQANGWGEDRMLTTTRMGQSELSGVSKWMLFKMCLLCQKSHYFHILSYSGILPMLNGSLHLTTTSAYGNSNNSMC